MKLTLAPPRTVTLVLVGLVSLMWPLVSPVDQPASADAGSYELLYDPGPSHDCWGRVVEGATDTSDAPHRNTSGCGAFAANKEFQRDGSNPQTTPTWDMGSLGWNNSAWGATPGFSLSAQTGSKTVNMTNNAAGAAGCALHETNVSYSYQNSQLRYGSDRKKLTLADGHVNVSYNASVHQTGDWDSACSAKRALLTTDFIFDDVKHGKTALISVVHYDGGNAYTGSKPTIVWETLDEKTKTCDPAFGCRVMVKSPAPMLTDAQKAPVSDDISALFDQYATYVNPEGLPKSNFVFRALQVVSSNVGGSTTSSVSNIDATLKPNGDVHAKLAYSDKHGTLCLDDAGNNRTSPADVEIYNCNTSTAQDWTIGLDNALKVDGLCLDAQGGGTANGTNVLLFTCNGGPNQKWVLGRSGQVYNPSSGRCLEVKGAAAQSGYSNLELFDCWGGANEKWWTQYGDFHDQ
ncbi:ricin-type beta-trefoil lectin domain protein [Streptomyces sp. RKAG337]|uniref:ricin-type beta-trefoil lectin domain protein n=1 Tax=Streptomyces sp. RKAG337 TaxID=2893404 RepID=UPI002033558E|nr:ricin-type beta-trefoil lectin domain protein [Streptomyces sp. RKAG337]MCM2425004.1 ricin-type beta-trefoil lectin domain protein [Streptomyces sp. RKAG337]